MEVVDDVKCERDVKKRLCGVNELCCILYPLFKEMLTKNTEKQNQQSSGSGNGKPGNSGFGLPQNSQGQQNGSNGQSDPNQNGNGSQNGSGNAQNNSSNGNGNGNSVDSMTAEQLSEALKEAVKQIEQAAKNVGVNNLPDRHSNSITNQASKSKDAKKRESGKQGSGNNATATATALPMPPAQIPANLTCLLQNAISKLSRRHGNRKSQRLRRTMKPTISWLRKAQKSAARLARRLVSVVQRKYLSRTSIPIIGYRQGFSRSRKTSNAV